MQTNSYDFRQPYEDLANGIIIKACEDYIQSLTELKEPKPDNSKKELAWITKRIDAISEIRRINRFFRSDLFSLLTSVDPEYIIQKLIELYGNKEIVKQINRTVFEKERI